MADLSNAELLDRIAAWQACPLAHPLTCGTDSRHPNLIGREVEGTVVLCCLRCDYVQTRVPDLPPREVIERHTKNYEALFNDGKA